jgi:hypothetical protein
MIGLGSIGGLAHSGLFHHRKLSALGATAGAKETLMKKTVPALLAATTIAVSLMASPNQASAGSGGAFAAGLFGGLVGGAIIGSALARPYPGYVAYSGAYASPPPPGCYWTRQPLYDAYGNIIGWRGRPIAVCP